MDRTETHGPSRHSINRYVWCEPLPPPQPKKGLQLDTSVPELVRLRVLYPSTEPPGIGAGCHVLVRPEDASWKRSGKVAATVGGERVEGLLVPYAEIVLVEWA